MALYLRENLTFDAARSVVEGTEEGKKLYMKGICIQGGVKNANERVYPVNEIETAVATLNEQITGGYSVLGEVDHPDDLKVNLDRVSHMIVSLKEDGNNYIGRAKIMTETPMGRIVKNLIDEGAQLGVSSRGMGSLKVNKEGVNEVQDDFYLATAADIVADPSAPDAFVRGIMEGKEWMMVEGRFVERDYDAARGIIRSTRGKDLDEVKMKVFEQFIKQISK
jgi:hypothetical protein